jgi:hypothetical protein
VSNMIAVRSFDESEVLDVVTRAKAQDLVKKKLAQWVGNRPAVRMLEYLPPPRVIYDRNGLSCRVHGRIMHDYAEAKELGRVTRATETIDGLPLVK